MKARFFALICCMCVPVFAFAQTSPEQSTLTVTGYGTEVVVPNAYQITVVLEQKGPVVTKLNKEMQARLEDIIRFLKKEGVDERNIQSLNINLYPQYESTSQGRREVGVVLNRQIRIQGQDLSTYDKVIDGLLSRGINRIDKFSFINTEEKQAQRNALVAAVQDAEQKAKLMAGQLSNKIIGVQSVNQQVGNPQVNVRAQSLMRAESSPTLPGTMDVSTSVRVTFLIAPKQ